MSKAYSITFDDLAEYGDTVANQNGEPVLDFAILASQLHLDGLSQLKGALDQGDTIESIRENNSRELLHDLEKLSKRKMVHGHKVKLPDFKQEFYQELEKNLDERSQEYREFIDYCNEHFTSGRHITELMSAQALKKLDEPELTTANLNSDLNQNISKYKKKYREQTDKDIDQRGAILYKGTDGITRHISTRELDSSDQVKLTGEQRDFIRSSWQQGSFGGGWLTAIPPEMYNAGEKNILKCRYFPAGAVDTTQILIDASGEKVRVYNRAKQSLMNAKTNERLGYSFEGTIAVDITDLKGEEFNPAISSAKPRILYDIEELGKDVSYNLPPGLKTSEPKHLSDYVKKESLIGYQNMISRGIFTDRAWDDIRGMLDVEQAANYAVANANFSDFKMDEIRNLKKYSTVVLEEDDRRKVLLDRVRALTQYQSEEDSLEKVKQAVEVYTEFELDNTKAQEFAVQQLDQYLSGQDKVVKLDSESQKDIKQGIMDIMSPVLSVEDQRVLERNAEKIVRNCASDTDVEMSFSQKWSQFKDGVSSLTNWLLGKEDKAKQLMEKHPEIKKSLRRHMVTGDKRLTRSEPDLSGRSANRGGIRRSHSDDEISGP